MPQPQRKLRKEKSKQESTKEIELESRNETLQPESKSASRKVWAETVNSEYQKSLPPSHNVPLWSEVGAK